MYNTFLTNNIDENQWDEFVDSHPMGSIYHLSSWKNVIQNSFKHITGQYIVVEDRQSKKIVAGLPVYHVKSRLLGDRLVSAPFAMCCDPLVSDPNALQEIVDCLLNLHTQVKSNYVEIRTLGDMPSQDGTFTVSGRNLMHEVTVDGDLDQLFKTFHKKSVRVLVNKAGKAGMTLKQSDHIDDLRVFYELFVQLRRQKALPPIPYAFFEALWHVYYNKGMLTLLLAVYKGDIVGGTLLLEYKKTLIAEYACDMPQFRKIGVNQFLDWECIKLVHSKRLSKYNFGRTSSTNHGLIQYKNKWATEMIPLPTYYYPSKYATDADGRELSIRYKMAEKVFKYSPPGLSKLIGDILYRHMG